MRVMDGKCRWLVTDGWIGGFAIVTRLVERSHKEHLVDRDVISS